MRTYRAPSPGDPCPSKVFGPFGHPWPTVRPRLTVSGSRPTPPCSRLTATARQTVFREMAESTSCGPGRIATDSARQPFASPDARTAFTTRIWTVPPSSGREPGSARGPRGRARKLHRRACAGVRRTNVRSQVSGQIATGHLRRNEPTRTPRRPQTPGCGKSAKEIPKALSPRGLDRDDDPGKAKQPTPAVPAHRGGSESLAGNRSRRGRAGLRVGEPPGGRASGPDWPRGAATRSAPRASARTSPSRRTRCGRF